MRRRAQLADLWDISSPDATTVDPITYDEATGQFDVDFVHGTAGTNILEIYTLPAGETPSSISQDGNACKTRGGELAGRFPVCFSWNSKLWVGITPSSPAYSACGLDVCIPCPDPLSSVDWISSESFTTDAALTSSNYNFKIEPSTAFSSGPNVFEGGVNPGDPGTMLFCILFAKTDDFQGEDTYGSTELGPIVTFREVIMKVTYTLDGTFELDDFQTQALAPVGDEEGIPFTVSVERCPDSPDVYDQLTEIPICICPAAANPVGAQDSIASVQDLSFAVAGGPSQVVLSGGDPETGAVAVTCDPAAAKEGVPDYCCRVVTLFNADFFPPPTSGTGNPQLLDVGLTGVALIQLGTTLDGSFAAGDSEGEPNTRHLVQVNIKIDRALETSDMIEREFEGDMSIIVKPQEVEASGSGASLPLLALGSAAAGAALLL